MRVLHTKRWTNENAAFLNLRQRLAGTCRALYNRAMPCSSRRRGVVERGGGGRTVCGTTAFQQLSSFLTAAPRRRRCCCRCHEAIIIRSGGRLGRPANTCLLQRTPGALMTACHSKAQLEPIHGLCMPSPPCPAQN